MFNVLVKFLFKKSSSFANKWKQMQCDNKKYLVSYIVM